MKTFHALLKGEKEEKCLVSLEEDDGLMLLLHCSAG